MFFLNFMIFFSSNKANSFHKYHSQNPFTFILIQKSIFFRIY